MLPIVQHTNVFRFHLTRGWFRVYSVKYRVTDFSDVGRRSIFSELYSCRRFFSIVEPDNWNLVEFDFDENRLLFVPNISFRNFPPK